MWKALTTKKAKFIFGFHCLKVQIFSFYFSKALQSSCLCQNEKENHCVFVFIKQQSMSGVNCFILENRKTSIFFAVLCVQTRPKLVKLIN
jgi:hypothetical protein